MHLLRFLLCWPPFANQVSFFDAFSSLELSFLSYAQSDRPVRMQLERGKPSNLKESCAHRHLSLTFLLSRVH